LKTVKHEFTILMCRFSLSNYHLNLLTRTSKLFTLLVSVAKELIRSWVGVRNTRRHTTQPDSFATRHSGSLLTVARSWMFCRGRPPCLSRVYPVSARVYPDPLGRHGGRADTGVCPDRRETASCFWSDIAKPPREERRGVERIGEEMVCQTFWGDAPSVVRN
jgi:hypothetical protein